MARKAIPTAWLLVGALALAACGGATSSVGAQSSGGGDGGGGGGVPTPVPDYLPSLPNTWFATDDHRHRFNFLTDAQAAGSFLVNEHVVSADQTETTFQGSGTLAGADIAFDVDHGDPTRWKFAGQFVDTATMDLTFTESGATSVSGKLILKRGMEVKGAIVNQAGQPWSPAPSSVTITVGEDSLDATVTANTFDVSNVAPFGYDVSARLSTFFVLVYVGLSRADPTLIAMQESLGARGPALDPKYDPTAAPGAQLSWKAIPGAVYVVHVNAVPDYYQLDTVATRAGLPADVLVSGTTWFVEAFGPFDSLDAAAAPAAAQVFANLPIARSASSTIP